VVSRNRASVDPFIGRIIITDVADLFGGDFETSSVPVPRQNSEYEEINGLLGRLSMLAKMLAMDGVFFRSFG
jgi:hypothetical protein